MRTHVERERKYELPLNAELPSLAGIAESDGPREETLSAVYYDTVDLRLARTGTTLRRRTGGDDAGWHLKVVRGADTRDEVQLPLSDSVPAELEALVLGHTRGEPLVPVARIVTSRSRWFLRDSGGAALGELTDDHVEASRLTGTGSDSWREVEVELDEGADGALFDRLRKTGLRQAAHGSKLARVLAVPALSGGKSAGHALVAYLRDQVDTLVRHDLLARRDTPDAVHQLRVASRRLRSVLRVYRRLLDRSVTDPLRGELKWLGRRLSPARDLEVLEERLGEAVSALPAELVVGPVQARLTRHFAPARAAAQKSVLRTLKAKRYLRLLDALDRLVTDPPLRGRASRRAAKELPRHLRRAHRKVSRRVSVAGEDASLLHSARKAAKQLRYGAEVAEPVLGKRLRRRAKAMTKVLGELQDSVVTRPTIRELGMTAHLAGENGFTYGLLHAHEHHVATDAVHEFTTRTWPRLT